MSTINKLFVEGILLCRGVVEKIFIFSVFVYFFNRGLIYLRKFYCF